MDDNERLYPIVLILQPTLLLQLTYHSTQITTYILITLFHPSILQLITQFKP